jgi:hypothetical protein
LSAFTEWIIRWAGKHKVLVLAYILPAPLCKPTAAISQLKANLAGERGLSLRCRWNGAV